MALTLDERAFAEEAHRRLCFRGRYRAASFIGMLVGLIPVSYSIAQMIRNPTTSHWNVAIFSGLLGAGYGLSLFSIFMAPSQRRRDEQLVRFFEQHYPDDCSWLEEKKILAAAEDIRVKAKVDLAIQKNIDDLTT